ncbi:DUF3887 domain-containing protein [Chryseobacterium kwangjuense]|uniref:DUF3887 domain-containing protein n=1 Tax=Chryseobacterium kwangjuense TaxID=267125 RepID=A0ABW9K820_9FLAO
MKKLVTLFIISFSLFTFSQGRKEIGNDFIKTLFIEKNAVKAHSYFDPSIAGEIKAADLTAVTEQIKENLGSFKNILEVNNEKDSYYYYSEFDKSKLDMLITFNGSDKIIGFVFVPHKIFDKADDKTFLKIKSDDIGLNGTLLVPEQDNKKKLVIFVHGSGAQDRDESVGENKPFKDIAEALFKNGIASYRYDKRIYSYPETFTEQSTVEQETISDAVNAAAYFKNNERFKGYQVIILGHSLGAYLMPEIAKKANASKYIFMAGNARPLQDLIIEQLEYIRKVDPSKVPEQLLETTKKQVSLLNSDKFSLTIPTSELPMGLSAAYWSYLMKYNPLDEVKNIKAPMFFAQGGRDYQVTEKDFSLWKNQLKNNKNVVFHLYPSLNHLFIKGSGVPAPKNYEIKGNVDQEFLNDLIQFVLK